MTFVMGVVALLRSDSMNNVDHPKFAMEKVRDMLVRRWGGLRCPPLT